MTGITFTIVTNAEEEIEMLSPHPTWSEVLYSELTEVRGHASHVRPSWLERLRARLFATRYDRQVDEGLTPLPGTALAVHHARLTAPEERADLSHALRVVLSDAEGTWNGMNPRIPVRISAVRQVAEVVDAVVQRLDEPLPVRARGMARLRILLADGRGPLYRSGTGSLNAAMRGVLAAL
jgi:hypothetical protein